VLANLTQESETVFTQPRAWLGGMVTSVSAKLLNDVALQTVRE
jgi:hypothetical protein